MSRRRYIVRIISASARPIETIIADTVRVRRECEGENVARERAMTPPEEEMTMSVTTGRSHLAVRWCRACCWRVFLRD